MSFAAAFGWCEAGFEIRDSVVMAKVYPHAAWDTLAPFADEG